MKLNKIPVRNKRIVISREVEEGTLIIFIDNEIVSLLEGFVDSVWKTINGKRSVGDIISKMSEEYAGTKNKITKNVEQAINGLLKRKAIYFKK